MFVSINELRDDYRDKIQSICNSIVRFDNNLNIYLFGSYAKGKVSQNSDIDLLILLNRDFNLKQCRDYKFKLEEHLYDDLDEIYDLDLKVYTEDVFNNLSKKIGFENHIKEYMINIYKGEAE